MSNIQDHQNLPVTNGHRKPLLAQPSEASATDLPVWIVSYSHRHGTDTTVHASEEDAWALVDETIRSDWNEIAHRDDVPATPPGSAQEMRAIWDDAQSCIVGGESIEVTPSSLRLPAAG